MVQAILGLAENATPDDAGRNALAMRSASPTRAVRQSLPTGALDRSALKPAPSGTTPYERGQSRSPAPRTAGLDPDGRSPRLPEPKIVS